MYVPSVKEQEQRVSEITAVKGGKNSWFGIEVSSKLFRCYLPCFAQLSWLVG